MFDFKLLIKLRDSLKEHKSLEFDQLKKRTKEFRDLHNKVTQHIWFLDAKIAAAEGKAQTQLRKERDDLEKLLKECNSIKTINDLLKEIEEQAKNDCGSITINPLSPYTI